MDLEEARKKLELALGEDLKKQYFAYLRQFLLFVPTLTKDEFDEKVRSLLHNANEIQCHNNFFLAVFNKACLSSKPKLSKQVNNKGAFEVPDYAGEPNSDETDEEDAVPAINGNVDREVENMNGVPNEDAIDEDAAIPAINENLQSEVESMGGPHDHIQQQVVQHDIVDELFEEPPLDALNIPDEPEPIQLYSWVPTVQDTECEDDDLQKCPICYGRKIRSALQCGHIFCSSCCKRLYNFAMPCPICREIGLREPLIIHLI